MISDEILVDIEETAKLLSEIEDQRKRVTNRRSALTRSEPDADGVLRGRGVPETMPTIVMLDEYLDGLREQEATMTKRLQRAMQRHPLATWITAQRGLGYKQLGRLLAVLEDPSWHPVEERPRTLAELTAYCGLVPGYKRRRGIPAEDALQWNPEAKMRTHLIAESAIKQLDRACRDGHVEDCRCGPYRLLYEQRRAATATKLHSAVCTRCGPAGHPAQPGSPWPPAHQHGDALRYVGKRILRDLFREARRANGFTDQAPASAA